MFGFFQNVGWGDATGNATAQLQFNGLSLDGAIYNYANSIDSHAADAGLFDDMSASMDDAPLVTALDDNLNSPIDFVFDLPFTDSVSTVSYGADMTQAPGLFAAVEFPGSFGVDGSGLSSPLFADGFFAALDVVDITAAPGADAIEIPIAGAQEPDAPVTERPVTELPGNAIEVTDTDAAIDSVADSPVDVDVIPAAESVAVGPLDGSASMDAMANPASGNANTDATLTQVEATPGLDTDSAAVPEIANTMLAPDAQAPDAQAPDASVETVVEIFDGGVEQDWLIESEFDVFGAIDVELLTAEEWSGAIGAGNPGAAVDAVEVGPMMELLDAITLFDAACLQSHGAEAVPQMDFDSLLLTAA